MNEEQIRAIKGKSFPKAPFSGEEEMRKWIAWADNAELVDAHDACLINARSFSVWIKNEQDHRNAERRHHESLVVDRSGRWALIVGCLALAVAVFATPQVQALISKPTTQRLQSSSRSSQAVVATSTPSSNPPPPKPEPVSSLDSQNQETKPASQPPAPQK